ncbi:MAG: hypothetical protein QOJ99_2046 [Bryobacterales bacterium]|jgi:hypothetical protein|nr:hypothetical protein [Bryobacterales bacterium]
MEYRGLHFFVFESQTPGVWTWSVDLDARTVETGHAVSREEGVIAGERLIDETLALPNRRQSEKP